MPKTNTGLVVYCEAQAAKKAFYWFGCFGQKASPKLLAAKRVQYPARYKATDFEEQSKTGRNVFDCAGLPKGYLMAQDYIDAAEGIINPNEDVKYVPRFDYSADALIAQCKEQGSYATMPNIKGLVVWKKGHMGVFTGTDIIEAKGHAWGVVHTPKVGGTKWEKWGKLPWIEYRSDEKEDDDVKLPTLMKTTPTMVLDSVARVQLILNYLGIRDSKGRELEVDKKYGGNTEFCVSRFQRTVGLPVTGIVDDATWQRLLT